MAHRLVAYADPDPEAAAAVVDGLGEIAPELTVSYVGPPREAVARFATDPVDCVVSAWIEADADRETFVEAVDSHAPTCPVVWFTDRPASVVERLADHSEYVYKQGCKGEYGVLARRLRSLLGDGSGATGEPEDAHALSVLASGAAALSAADSERAIAEIGIETAVDGLGFEDAIVFDYAESTNVFRPLAHTAGAETNFPGLPAIDAVRTSIAGRAFFEAEPISTPDMSDHPAVTDPETPYRRALFLPLGEHGVLFVGDTTAGTTTVETLTAGRLLAALLTAALDRHSADRLAATREDALAARTAELEARIRTDELAHELVDELVSATSRAEIDSAVCRTLAAVDRCRFVWIGAAEGRDGAVTPRTAAGEAGDYLDWLADAADATTPTAAEPAARALATGSTVWIPRIADDWQTAPWRKEALSRGYQSVLSVPLAHAGISYGVLSIYADTQAALPAHTRRVLAAFGRVIGYVIESTETKRGLLADHRTEIELDIDTADPIQTLAAALDEPLTVEGFVPQSEGRSLLYVAASDLPTAAIEAAVDDSPAVDTFRVVTRQVGTTLFELTVSEPVVAATVVDAGGIPSRIATDGRCQQVVVTIPQSADVRAVVDRITATYPSSTVVSRHDHDGEIRTRETFQMELFDRLTRRQRETLRAAYFARYFESPRGSTGTDVARSLEITQPTFTYHLRAALKTVLTMVFEEPPSLDS
ncbi:bacterio-opsin activator domain-containing protein [Halohasta salina]|uniref:bacterio-opsin activator domain-containing protein n=1 Tax=Halohasta salina TaxID=2961621 RepID=UPI0020A5D05E|nr:bacterio-opsin activator domain-containing protein [Halohasta salina]